MRPANASAIVLALGLGLGAPRTEVQAAAASARPIPIPVAPCHKNQEGEWLFVQGAQLGVQARNREGGDWVGLTAATDGFHDWAPFDDFKTTICGRLASFATFEPARENPLLRFLPEIPEHDWNIIVVPTADSIFDERFKLAQRLMERGHEGDLEECNGSACFEAEVTPHRALLRANAANEWLSSSRRGQTICTFGPWVGDGGHGYRPEIHPAERIWWRDGARLKLLFVQDASQRFTDHRQFQWGVTSEPGRWQPWARPGLQGEFRIAFDLAKGSKVEFRVDQLLDGSTLGVHPPVADTRPVFSLTQNGVEVGLVNVRLGVAASADRLELDLSRLDVAPVEMCERSDGTLQGYLSLHDRVGQRYQDGEGFDAFEVVAPSSVGRIPTVETDSACSPSTPQDPASDDHDLLRLAVRIVAREEEVGGQLSTESLRPQSTESTLTDLLRAATESEIRLGGTGTTLPASLLAKAERERRADIVLESARLFRLSARPHYDGPRGERLETTIDHANLGELRRLLTASHAAIPAKVAWALSIRDFTAGADLPGHCRSGTHSRLLEDDECEIELPTSIAPDHVLRVRAVARLLDAQGQPLPDVTTLGGDSGSQVHPQVRDAQQEIRIASHFIRSKDAKERDAVLSWLARAFTSEHAGPDLVSVATSQSETYPQCGDLSAYRQGYYARMLRHGLVLASVDRRITLDELRQFVEMARAFADLSPLTAVPVRAMVK